jgi:spore germination cell wall hydrolase CwlJ-like protein
MFNINVTSKAVIVATILAVISLSALEAKADNIDWSHYIIYDNSNIDFEENEKEIREYLQSTLSENDINCLARNIYYESRGEPISGQEWVAWVTINRANHEEYPSTICKVVHQCNRNNICQFSWVRSNKNSTPKEQEAWEQSVEIAVNVLLEEKFGNNTDPSDGAIMFHSDSVKPKWRHSYEMVGQIGSHVFYKDQS